MSLVHIVIAGFVMSFSLNSMAAVTRLTSAAESAAVMQSLKSPANPTAVLLKAMLQAARTPNSGLGRQSKVTVEKVGNENEYRMVIAIEPGLVREGAEISANVVITNGQAYVFNFKAARVMELMPAPGVGMGNR